MSNRYRVVWTVDVEASEGPVDAAMQALRMQRDGASIATCFEVFDDEGGKVADVDLHYNIVAFADGTTGDAA